MEDGECNGVTHTLGVNELLRSRIKSVIAVIEDEGNVKINRQELAAALDITPVYLSNIISGKKVPNTELVFKLAKILERKVDDLYIYEEE